MTTRGTIRGNTIELDRPSRFPEGSRVELQLEPIAEFAMTIEQRIALLNATRGSIPADAALVAAVLAEDYFGTA